MGKSSLAQRLLLSDGIPWFPTDVLRTVLRRVLPELDELDQGNVSATAVSEVMYPHIERAVEVCSEEAEQFLIEGPDIVPSMVPRLSTALRGDHHPRLLSGKCPLHRRRSCRLSRAETAARGGLARRY